MTYDEGLKIYGLRLAQLLNEFMKQTQLEEWDGPEPIKATQSDGEIILEDWAIKAVSIK